MPAQTLVDPSEAKMIRNDKGINIVVFGKLGIGIPELLDLLWIEHMQASVETTETAAFAKETHEIITVD